MESGASAHVGAPGRAGSGNRLHHIHRADGRDAAADRIERRLAGTGAPSTSTTSGDPQVPSARETGLPAAGVGRSGSLTRTGALHWKPVVLEAIAIGLGYQLLFFTSRRRPRSSWF